LFLNAVFIDIFFRLCTCIRNGGDTAANIDRAYQEGVTMLMGHRAFIEGRKVEWDSVNRRII
jgi:hypothetical protein